LAVVNSTFMRGSFFELSNRSLTSLSLMHSANDLS
jgi:hypothetical protein